MIITNKENGWPSKVNFVDKNDVFVGYDLYQCCCEDAGYFFSDKEDEAYGYGDNGNEELEKGLDGYTFDTEFFECVESDALEDGGQVCFKLVCEGKQDIYLHLYNAHNGYYSHGFEANIGGQKWQEDYL